MRIYLDVCCLSRPFDNQSQERVRLESEAVLMILQRIQIGEWQLVNSEVIEDEIEQTPDPKKRERLYLLLLTANEYVQVTESTIQRAKQLKQMGFASVDALHMACAEEVQVDVFLTTDNKLRRQISTLNFPLSVRIDNPLDWILEQEQ
jgi:predicted nucleic acid-binding protein